MLNNKKPLIIFTILLIIISGFALTRIYLLKDSETEASFSETEIQEEEEIVILDEYGLPSEAYIVETGVVKPRQTLSHILEGFDMTAIAIDGIVKKVREVFDPRYVRAGNQYLGYYSNDSIKNLQYFVYEISPLDYIVLDFNDSLTVQYREKDVMAVRKTGSGIISSSLWNVLTENNLSPELAIRLSEILAWEVDFYRIQKGDRFKVIFQENYVGDKPIGIAQIDAVYFQHQGRDIYGYHFVHDTINGFFNPEGASLRKVFLKAPLEFGRISSRFSHSRFHPVHKTRKPHYGTDYAAPHGTPILAVGDGIVSVAGYSRGNGNYVKIRHNSVYDTQYLHMSRFAKGIKKGTPVKQGQVIGYVGATGVATGPHVCFRFWKNGRQVDHLKEEFPSADPLHQDYHQVFYQLRDSLTNELNQIPFREEMPV